MTPIQQRDIIRGMRARWLDQYKTDHDSKETGWRGGTFGEVRARLAALDLETCSAEDTAKALGGPNWAENTCDNCGKSWPVIIRIGQEPDYDARWQDLCGECLGQAVDILSKTEPLK